MIPQRVKLKGFLCYKDEQTIDFQGSPTLWMLSGLNGSGKSAIFDAVTFALFGHHRGGATGNVELINKDADTLSVEFDFLLDGHMCRSKRTLRRDTKGGARSTQQMLSEVDGKFIPVAETGQKREFDKWVADNIGLNYDTFTSSVLLLQGRAEKLLDSRPEGRREVLAGIVDLGRYEKLHQKSDEKRKSLDGQVKALNGRLAVLPDVKPLELAAARMRITEMDEGRKSAQAEVERLRALEFQARSWLDLQARLVQARSRHTRAQSLLAGSAAIEQAMERLRELREVTPRLQEIVVMRGQLNQATQQRETLESRRELKLTQRGEKESAVKEAELRRRTLQQQIDSDSRRLQDLTAKVQKIALQAQKLDDAERNELDLERIDKDLGALPASPHEATNKARETLEQLEALGRIVPILERFRTRREELASQVEAAGRADEAMKNVAKQGDSLRTAAAERKKDLEKATQKQARAAEQATEAKTLHKTAARSLKELSELDGAHICRHCGQALTPGHIEEQKVTRSKEERAADQHAKTTAQALDAAQRAEREASRIAEEAEAAYQKAREDWSENKSRQEQAKAAVKRLQRECAEIYADLPPEHAGRVARGPVTDWLETKYPVPADVEKVRAEAGGVTAARRAFRDAEATEKQFATLTARGETIRITLERLLAGLPADRATLRKDHAGLQHEQGALYRSIDATRVKVAETEKEVTKLTRERDQVQAEFAQIETDDKERALIQDNARRNIATQIRALPEAWRRSAETIGMQQMNVFVTERETLDKQGVEEQSRELEHARANLQVLRQDVEALERQEANYSPEARRKPEEILTALNAAKSVENRAEEDQSAARQTLMQLEEYDRQRQEVRTELLTLDGELSTYKTLSELLGRERLQLYLVRQAERQVVEYANAVLDRLSGGNLYLRLSGEASGEQGTAKALELEAYNRATGDRPINVAFLSGSQKFRVAVSLALGIGQYASKQHRPIESVIIDEGFGCLDSQGRQVMIQELQNLRSQMRCILLVSHQEDFAEAFSDGYQFKLENGATRVERFQR